MLDTYVGYLTIYTKLMTEILNITFKYDQNRFIGRNGSIIGTAPSDSL